MNIVSDPSANADEKIERAAKVLRASKQNKEVFKAIYAGGKWKSLEDIKQKVNNFNTNTYKAAAKLYGEDIIDKKSVGKILYYGKKAFYNSKRDSILKLAADAKRLKAYPTKRKVQINSHGKMNFVFRSKPNVQQIYVDNINSFKKAHGVEGSVEKWVQKISERAINIGICKILNQSEKKDWGGERNDIYTNNIIIFGTRKSAALALKGKAVGKLVLGKMGKNGDQIPRLFEATADAYFIVHNNDIDDRIVDMAQTCAIEKSISKNKKIYFCTIDGKDLIRLIKAYPKEFGLTS